jgi:hypothetical protein
LFRDVPSGNLMVSLSVPPLPRVLHPPMPFMVSSPSSDIAAVCRLGPLFACCLVAAVLGLGPLCHCCIPDPSSVCSRSSVLCRFLVPHCAGRFSCDRVPCAVPRLYCGSFSCRLRPIASAVQNFRGSEIFWRRFSCAVPLLHYGTTSVSQRFGGTYRVHLQGRRISQTKK